MGERSRSSLVIAVVASSIGRDNLPSQHLGCLDCHQRVFANQIQDRFGLQLVKFFVGQLIEIRPRPLPFDDLHQPEEPQEVGLNGPRARDPGLGGIEFVLPGRRKGVGNDYNPLDVDSRLLRIARLSSSRPATP